MIDKQINLRTISKNTPQYYIWINNVIDCCINLKQVKTIIKSKCPRLNITDEELERHKRLYVLLGTLKKIKK